MGTLPSKPVDKNLRIEQPNSIRTASLQRKNYRFWLLDANTFCLLVSMKTRILTFLEKI